MDRNYTRAELKFMERQSARAHELAMIKEFINNDTLLLIGGFTLVEALQSYKMMGSVAGTSLETALVLIPALKAVTKPGVLTELTQSGAQAAKTGVDTIKDIAGLIPIATALLALPGPP
jgi:hypothetical protein